ncbi:hypothetical protein [Asticcacaulis taihuensis]|uniref:hypothetical protein n=1 Tax=Asticcacaulis taihuensis TaxID=260084 RepID=UPI0026EB9D17|nr:hypothetical protein [Asticcacaulis taihuensis]
MISRTAPSGRFIYAFHKTMERSNEALTNMYAEGELSPCEVEQERIYDHRRRFLGVAITIS